MCLCVWMQSFWPRRWEFQALKKPLKGTSIKEEEKQLFEEADRKWESPFEKSEL